MGKGVGGLQEPQTNGYIPGHGGGAGEVEGFGPSSWCIRHSRRRALLIVFSVAKETREPLGPVPAPSLARRVSPAETVLAVPSACPACPVVHWRCGG